MPRYFLHTEHFGQEPITDDEGAVFDNVEAAVAEASEGIRELLAAAIRDPAAPVPRRIAIVDETGMELRNVLAKNAVPRELR